MNHKDISDRAGRKTLSLLSKSGRKPKEKKHSIYYDNKLLVLVVYIAELVWTGSWDFWSEQHAPYTQLLHRPAREESNVPKLKSS